MSMLTITKEQEDSKLTVALIGRVDTTTSPQLENEIAPSLGEITDLTLDCSQAEYISSAGLRVLLDFYKTMTAKGGKFTIIHANHVLRKMFAATGLIDYFDVQ